MAECNAVRQALQDLLSEYMNNTGGQHSPRLDAAIDLMCQKTKDLRRQLRKAVVDHVSDSFIESTGPLLHLVEAAREGRERDVEELSQIFTEHTNKLVEVANLACSMSGNEEGVTMVRYAAQPIQTLCPQVINAARILASRPRSKVAQENMDVFKDAWEAQVRILTDAVDDIVTVDDFLSVSENHILEDVNRCCLALQERDPETLDRIAGAIRGRSVRISGVVACEMENYEPGVYTERVLEAIRLLRSEVMPNFSIKVDDAVVALTSLPPRLVDENEFIDASRLVYDGVREVRRAVLLNRAEEEIDTDTDWEEEGGEMGEMVASEVGSVRPQVESRTDSVIDEYPNISGQSKYFSLP